MKPRQLDETKEEWISRLDVEIDALCFRCKQIGLILYEIDPMSEAFVNNLGFLNQSFKQLEMIRGFKYRALK